MTVENTILLSRKLLALQREKGWNQRCFSRRAGISPAAMSRILRDQRVPSTRTIIALARALEIPPSELVEGTDHENMFAGFTSGVASGEDSEQADAALQAERARAQELQSRLDQALKDLDRSRKETERAHAARDRSLRLANTYFAQYKSAMTAVARARNELMTARDAPVDANTLIEHLSAIGEKDA